MNYQNNSSFGFEDLDVYKAARALRKKVYKLAKSLPADERFALKQQMTRSAVSITSNIAEGHGRYHWQDNTRFCRQARGSLCELVDQFNNCQDQNYCDNEFLESLRCDATEVLKLLNGYIGYLQKKAIDQKTRNY